MTTENRIRKFYDVPPAERADTTVEHGPTDRVTSENIFDAGNDNERHGKTVFLAFVLGCACGGIAIEIALWMVALVGRASS
jgi:hypothetical protein